MTLKFRLLKKEERYYIESDRGGGICHDDIKRIPGELEIDYEERAIRTFEEWTKREKERFEKLKVHIIKTQEYEI